MEYVFTVQYIHTHTLKAIMYGNTFETLWSTIISLALSLKNE